MNDVGNHPFPLPASPGPGETENYENCFVSRKLYSATGYAAVKIFAPPEHKVMLEIYR